MHTCSAHSHSLDAQILVALLHPHLTAVRNTPHGKRIHNKILKTQLLHDLTNDACSETPTYLATSPCTFLALATLTTTRAVRTLDMQRSKHRH